MAALRYRYYRRLRKGITLYYFGTWDRQDNQGGKVLERLGGTSDI